MKEDEIFKKILSETEGWVAPRFNKPVSFAITRRLIRFPITPNQITAANLLIALAASFFLVSTNYWQRVLGALLMQFSSIVDGCDGEVAKIKGLSSRFGAWFDTIADDFANNLFFASLFVGLFRSTGHPLYWQAGLVGLALSLVVSGVIYHHLLTQGKSANAKDVHPSWQEGTGKGEGFFEKLRPVLKRDFFIAVIFVFVVIDWRAVVFWMGLAATLAAFSLYAVSFVRLKRMKD